MTEGSVLVRRATADDEPFLWTMLYYAAHMDELGVEMSAIRETPALAKYVAGWGRRGDLGAVAVDAILAEAAEHYERVALKVRRSSPACASTSGWGFRKCRGGSSSIAS